jgi:hypothetical protein
MSFTNVFGVAVKNSDDRTRVEYVEGGLNKSKMFDTYEDAEKWVKAKGLKKGDPHGTGSSKEYRFTN